jgi:hypothetical protein
MAKLTPSKQLNDLLISKNFDPQLLNREGKPAQSSENADVFSFNYEGTSGKDYGTVAILLGDDNNMDIYFGDNLGKGMDPEDKKGWFDFLYQLRQFAKRNLQSFGIADLNKLKYSMKGQAAIKEGLFESWRGTSTQSWTRYPNDVKLVIRHSRPLSENDKRYRYIQTLFLETQEGERFKLPFTKLSGGRAMVQHVRQGGNPYDIRGQHICEMVKNINLLSQFKRASRNQIFEGEAATLLETATKFYESIKKNLYSLISPTGYKNYFESWKPEDIKQEDLIIEDIKGLFVTQTIDTRIENALPLLAKLQQENNMKELSIFEGYLNCITEGTWSLPDTEEKQQELISLLSDEFPVGPDATNATEQLYDILGNDSLFDELQDLAKEDPNADARVIIINFLERLKHDKNVAQVIGKLNVETAGEPVETEKDAMNNSSNQERGQIEEGDYDAIANIKELAQNAMVDFGYYDASEFKPEELDMIADEAQVSIQDVCDVLGVKCPENLEEHGSGVENMKGKSWQSSKAGAHPWNATESKLEEGHMKDVLWDLAERMDRDQFIEYTATEMGQDEKEMGEFWDNIMGDLEEGRIQEGSMKDAMHRDAERMSLEKFVAKYGDEEWVREFYNNIMGDLGESNQSVTNEESTDWTDDKRFVDYVYSFYGPGGVYDMGVSKDDIMAATEIHKKQSDIPFDGDTVDRESVRDILISDFGYEWIDEGIKGAIAGGLAGAALTKTPMGAIRGAQIGDKLGDMVSENLTWEPKTRAGEVTDEFFGEMTNDELFAADLARMKSLAMIK